MALTSISQSSFMKTPHEGFHSMQNDWRQEIEEVLLDLRRKEKVCLFNLYFLSMLYTVTISLNAAWDRHVNHSKR